MRPGCPECGAPIGGIVPALEARLADALRERDEAQAASDRLTVEADQLAAVLYRCRAELAEARAQLAELNEAQGAQGAQAPGCYVKVTKLDGAQFKIANRWHDEPHLAVPYDGFRQLTPATYLSYLMPVEATCGWPGPGRFVITVSYVPDDPKAVADNFAKFDEQCRKMNGGRGLK